jgi:hypothetical protein
LDWQTIIHKAHTPTRRRFRRKKEESEEEEAEGWCA